MRATLAHQVRHGPQLVFHLVAYQEHRWGSGGLELEYLV